MHDARVSYPRGSKTTVTAHRVQELDDRIRRKREALLYVANDLGACVMDEGTLDRIVEDLRSEKLDFASPEAYPTALKAVESQVMASWGMHSRFATVH